ncbi:MAG: beta-L-arabinofuranosidase domain-containing protein [Pseudomonadota bacterium]
MSILRHPTSRRQALLGMALLGVPIGRAFGLTVPSDTPTALPFRVAPALANVAEVAPASAVRLGGWLGARVDANAQKRLLNIDTAPLLAGFQHKPGTHPWIGEHVGKWMHAATLAWANSGNPALRTKLDSVVGDLITAQESDGYLGTYLPEDRFAMHEGAEWDVWSHKYCLLGLLTYHQYTGHAGALAASRKVGDLLIATFPAQRSINAAGHHMGMAATSVLEPVVLLYRMTADPRYLAFARYIVATWDEAGGAHIVRTLLNEGKVRAVGNGKAYEMLSNIVGCCELARVTGDQALIDASLAAWSDIVATQRFATGTTSRWEYFQRDHDLRGDTMAHVGETCVTTTWIQLNLSLLQLTGEARFGDELERSWYNHLSAAQHPGGDDWCYFTALEGRKHYDRDITCCHSSGPRGMALAPMAAYLVSRSAGEDTLLVNSCESSTATLMLGGQSVRAAMVSNFPRAGQATLTLHMARPARFALKVRVPEWAMPMAIAGATLRDGWAQLPAKRWRNGDTIMLRYTLGTRMIEGEHNLEGRAAAAYGPFILAYDADANPALGAPYLLRLRGGASVSPTEEGELLSFAAPVSQGGELPQTATLRTFADAGAGGGVIRVWLRSPNTTGAPPYESLLLGGVESRSRSGTIIGSINDEDYETLVATNDGTLADEDWFAISMDGPVTAQRFHFMHGRNFHDGGWFDTSGGKPQLQLQRAHGGAWETMAVLDRYPATTASDAGALAHPWASSEFPITLDAPQRFTAVRVIGKPACGDNAAQSFASCTQLQAFTV